MRRCIVGVVAQVNGTLMYLVGNVRHSLRYKGHSGFYPRTSQPIMQQLRKLWRHDFMGERITYSNI